jgi:hypothetical protein
MTTVYELIKELEERHLQGCIYQDAANMLRQQAETIAELEKLNDCYKKLEDASKIASKPLSQQYRKPVAWRKVVGNVTKHYQYNEIGEGTPLYTTPQTDKFVGDLKNITNAQGQKGCWDVSPYMTGLFNGLEMALSIFEQREPQFKDTTPQTKPLSDEEIAIMSDKILCYQIYDAKNSGVYEFARAIEAKVRGEK